MTVAISWELCVNWKLTEAPEHDVSKILYEFGKRHIVQKMQEGSLSENEELTLTTQSAPNQCPFEVARIDEPEGATFEVGVEPSRETRAFTEVAHRGERRRQQSQTGLIRLYELAGGRQSVPVTLGTVAKAEGWSRREMDEVYASLMEDNFIKHFAAGGYILVLTHQGVVAAESVLEDETVRKRRLERARVLEKLYEETLQQGPVQIDLEPVAVAEGIEGQELDGLYEFLIGEGFVRSYGAGYYVIMLPEDQFRVEKVMTSGSQIELFFCYSHEDEKLRDELEKHLRLMQRQGIISAWHDRKIGAGTEWEGEISQHLSGARVILLLVSVDFINSDYCWNVEAMMHRPDAIRHIMMTHSNKHLNREANA